MNIRVPDHQLVCATPFCNGFARDVVDFWRAAGPGKWFAKDPEFARIFRERFLVIYDAAANGMLDIWLANAESALALVIMLDQFPRNAFRGTAHMYLSDVRARYIASMAIADGHDRMVESELAMFFYLPFSHSEDIRDQERAVRLFRRLGEPAIGHAIRHHGIIARYGRFPHRTAILGRALRPEEEDFLANGGFAG
jgi:uncharacterized protein (DUF924 family)